MAIKIRDAEREVYMDLEEFLANTSYNDTGRDRNKMVRAQIKVINTLRKKIEKLAPKVTTTNAS